jgi:excisionase family DNA binding protein
MLEGEPLSHELLTVGDAAQQLKVSETWVRQLERDGRITAIRTRSGVRLFRAEDVDRLQRERSGER